MGSRSTLTLSVQMKARLEDHGARPNRGRANSYSAHMRWYVELYSWIVTAHDPRKTRNMQQQAYDLVVEGLPAPETMQEFQVAHLGELLRMSAGFLERAKGAGVEAEAICALLDSYPFPEQLHLYDAAFQRTAQPRSTTAQSRQARYSLRATQRRGAKSPA